MTWGVPVVKGSTWQGAEGHSSGTRDHVETYLTAASERPSAWLAWASRRDQRRKDQNSAAVAKTRPRRGLASRPGNFLSYDEQQTALLR